MPPHVCLAEIALDGVAALCQIYPCKRLRRENTRPFGSEPHAADHDMFGAGWQTVAHLERFERSAHLCIEDMSH
eukprot:5797674-Amphidinium_carterae.1